MTRRLAGDGMVRQRPDGRWEARYRASDGRKRSIYARTQRDAIDRLRAALNNRDQGIRPVDQRLTVGDFLDDWIEHHVRPARRPRTVESYASIVELYLKPALGKVPLAKLEPEHVQTMLARLHGRRGELSPSTRRYVYAVLRIALGRAVKMGRSARNVCTLIDPPAKARHELRPLSGEQLRRFLDGIRGDRLAALYVAAAGTGLRQGELLALRWQDVDLDARELTVHHTLQRGARILAAPKTDRAHRTLRLPLAVVAALQEHRRRQAVVPLSGHIFTTSTGAPLDARNVTRYLQRHLERLGLPHQRFHDLRHAFATLLIESGEELGVVSRILGHADYATTADVYAHLTPAMLDRTADRMESILTSGRAASPVR